MNSDPLYQRLVRDQPMPRLPGPIGVALIVAVTSLIGAQVFAARSIVDVRAMVVLPMAIFLLAPIITAGFAAAITARYASTDEYGILRLSPIPRDALIWAYFRAVLYRLQMLYALVIGLLPLPLVVIAGATIFRVWLRDSPEGIAALLIGLAADNLAAAAVGIALGLRFRRAAEASIIAMLPFVGLAFLFALGYPTVLTNTYYFSVPVPAVMGLDWAAVVLKVIVIVLPVLTLPILRWAEQWV